MKLFGFLLSTLLVLTSYTINAVFAQQMYTPYDELPCIQSSLKPAFQETLPEWAKMLYTSPINYFEIEKAYQHSEEKKNNTKSAITRYYKIWRRCIQPYVTETGDIMLPDMETFYRIQKHLQENTTKQTAENRNLNDNSWTFLGPKQTFWLKEDNNPAIPASCPWQVNVYSMDVASKDVFTIYAGTETGFLNKSTDKGETWTLLAPDYFFGGGITAVTIDPLNNNIIYVSAGNQIHKSTDGGNTWAPKLGNDRFAADRLRIDPSNPNHVYAASSKGIYISKDGGETWTRKWSLPTWDVRINPTQSNIVYGITTSNGIFRLVVSTDFGGTFVLEDGFPTNIQQTDGAMLSVTTDDPNRLLAVLLSANDTPYLLKGVFENGTWTWNTLATGRTSNLRMDNGQGYFDLVLEISPVNKNLVFVGTTTLYKSVNGGTSFTPIGGYEGNFPIHPDIQDMKILENGETWVATDGGMNYSSDHFTNVANHKARVNGLIGSDFWGFDQGWNEDIVVGGRYHNGNTSIAEFHGDKALRMGGAESPTGWVLQGKSRHVAFNDLGSGWILPKTAEGRPEGRFIFSKYPNMDEYGGRRGNLVHHPIYSGTLFLGEGNTLWKSEDSGVNWEMWYTFPARVMYFVISHSHPDVIYADVNGRGIYKSEDGGKTFVQKSASISSAFGGSYWGGKLHIDVSPNDPNTVYICQQNGTWSADIGRVLKSTNGGDTWQNITDNVSAYLKSILVQPGQNDEDVIYLFTNARNMLGSKVYFRKTNDTAWQTMDIDYPAGMYVNIPKIFYRDSKIRVSGNAGVWEHPLVDTLYEPVIQPWVEKKIYDCVRDTVYFDDHSILDHDGVTWKWTITPDPEYISATDIRNPKVVLGSTGSYDVTLEVLKNGKLYTMYFPQMVSAKSCPSVDDCDNPAFIAKSEWKLKYANSQEVNDPGLASMSFDDNPNTIWHTRWSTGSDPYPHEIQIDLNNEYLVSEFELLNRQDGENGRIQDYELYFSLDGEEWGEPISAGSFENTSAPQKVRFDTPVKAKFFRLIALSEVNGNPWASAAEFSVKGCYASFSDTETIASDQNARVFPVPSTGIFNVEFPDKEISTLTIYDLYGKEIVASFENVNGTFLLDLSHFPQGMYIVRAKSISGIKYVVRMIKN